METNKRSVIKAISWRALASFATFVISYVMSGDITVATGIASVQVVVNLLLYYFHERVWNKIRWGREHV